MKEKKEKRKTNSSAPRANTSNKTTKTRKATAKNKVKAKPKASAKSRASIKTPDRTTNVKTTNTKCLRRRKEKPQVVFPKLTYKGTFNTHDIMHAPVEKTIKMLEKIIAGERLFTM